MGVMRTVPGNLFVVSAPSGAGKTSLLRELVAQDKRLRLSVSHTTRVPRPGEEQGVHYHFVDRATFESQIAAGDFLEYAQVFDNLYGSSEQAVKDQLAAGQDLVLEIDWQGAQQVRKRFADAVFIFILPPSRESLRERLQAREQDSEAVINRRMRDAVSEMSHYVEYDFLIINDVFDQALRELGSVVSAQRLRIGPQSGRLEEQLGRLLFPAAEHGAGE